MKAVVPLGAPGRSTGWARDLPAPWCEDDSGRAAHEAVSTPSHPWGGLHRPEPSPSGGNTVAMQSSAGPCSSSPGSWLGPKGESTMCPAHPDPASMPSPWDPEHRADLPGHHPSSNAASGSLHGSTRQGESTAPPPGQQPALSFRRSQTSCIDLDAIHFGLGHAVTALKCFLHHCHVLRVCSKYFIHFPLPAR